MTRAEHLAWAKQRALEYVDRGELAQAVTSMLSDLSKRPEFNMDSPAMKGIAQIGILFEIQKGPEAVRRWIEGFN